MSLNYADLYISFVTVLLPVPATMSETGVYNNVFFYQRCDH